MSFKTEIVDITRGPYKWSVKIRPNTTDEQVIKEVLVKNQYEKKAIPFLIEEGDVFLDAGSNIGLFSINAATLVDKIKIYAFEPEPDNFKLLNDNIVLNNLGHKVKTFQKALSTKESVMDLYLGRTAYQKYRHTLRPVRGRESIKVKVVDIRNILEKFKINAIKMDIEGAEIEILEAITDWKKYGINKLVFEYDFDQDKSIDRFNKIIKQLKKSFNTIKYPKMPPDDVKEYLYYPSGILVFCCNIYKT